MTSEKSGIVTIRVRVGDAEFEVTGPPEYVERKIEEFLEKHSSIGLRTTNKTGQTVDEIKTSSLNMTKSTSIAQFFNKINPRSAVDRVLAAGYYLEKVDGLESFTAAETSNKIRGAKVPPPKNPSDVINQNIKKGHIMAAGDKDGKLAFVLTTDGERQIEDIISQAE